MKLLAFIIPPSAFYHGCFVGETFWEEKLTPVNMKFLGRHNISKHMEINNGEKYIILDISSNIDCLYKREVTSSESKYYMVISGKALTIYLDIRNKR